MQFIQIEANLLRPADKVLMPFENGTAMRLCTIKNVGRNTMGITRLTLEDEFGVLPDQWVLGNADKVFAKLEGNV